MVIQTPLAPLDRAAVEQSLLPFGSSRMLPRAAYVDPGVFAWEQAHFFDGGWMCVGRSQDIAQPGDQRAEPTGAGSVLLVRGQDRVLRAFANTCRHRGHELLACGATRQEGVVICPYHSWTYSLSGDLRAAAGFARRADFDRAAHGLLELAVQEWHGLVFVDGSGSAPSLRDAFCALEELVAPYEPERLRVAGRHDYVVPANWKILTENYHECYHCPTIHPELCRVSPPKSGENYDPQGPWVGGWMELREGMDTMSLDGSSQGRVLRGRHLPATVPQHPAEPAPGLRHDPPADSPVAGPDAHRMHLGIRAGGRRVPRFRSLLRRGLLGHHQPSGLGGVLLRPARPEFTARGARPAVGGGGRGLPVRHDDRARLSRRIRVGVLPCHGGVNRPLSRPAGARRAG
jgi:nitrite reductase/ring-hydroxylating ferredoxin subunit